MGLSRTRLCGSRTYREYLQPLGIEYTMVTGLPVRDGVTHSLGLTRNAQRHSFVGDDCVLMNELVPHLERALQISRAVAEARASRDRRPRQSAAARSESWKRSRLQSTFTLSPAQARLASLLFQGQRLKQAAAQLGITEGSARQYLKVIFAKTGAKRQADLVRVIGETLRPEEHGEIAGALASGAEGGWAVPLRE
jgi:DNA-binding CsgD family transcriptional regulator